MITWEIIPFICWIIKAALAIVSAYKMFIFLLNFINKLLNTIAYHLMFDICPYYVKYIYTTVYSLEIKQLKALNWYKFLPPKF